MKQVLIIDASPMLGKFIKAKLDTENVNVEFANGHRDGVTKLLSILPDLVILDIESSVSYSQEFLEKKRNDPNGKHIPMIVCGPIIDKSEVASLLQYGIFKYFTKPIKFDVFFESVGKVLRLDFTMDSTPCVLDLHLNGKIIFIEIAMGLNREKIMLMRYKLAEIIDSNGLKDPKVVLMMTDLNLSFVDGANLELLFSNIIADGKVRRRNVKILSLSQIVKDLIDGHVEYNGMQVVSDLSSVLGSLMDPSENKKADNVQSLISDKILTSTIEQDAGVLATRFSSDVKVDDSATKEGDFIKAAILDDDQVIRTLLSAAFKNIGATLDIFTSGEQFLMALEKNVYDVLILDIFMPGLSGFDILKTLIERKLNIPVVVYSQAVQKEAIVQALSLGAKAYLIKPQKPEAIIQKVTEVIHAKNPK